MRPQAITAERPRPCPKRVQPPYAAPLKKVRPQGAAEEGTAIRRPVIKPQPAVGNITQPKAVAAVGLANAVRNKPLIERPEEVGADGGTAVPRVAQPDPRRALRPPSQPSPPRAPHARPQVVWLKALKEAKPKLRRQTSLGRQIAALGRRRPQQRLLRQLVAPRPRRQPRAKPKHPLAVWQKPLYLLARPARLSENRVKLLASRPNPPLRRA